MLRAQERANVPSTSRTRGRTMDQSGSTGSEAPQTPPPAEPAPTTQWAPPPPSAQAGPAGFVYADVPNRAIAYIIDAILVGIVAGIIGGLLGGFGLATGTFEPGTLNFQINVAGVIVSGDRRCCDQCRPTSSTRGPACGHGRHEDPRDADRQRRGRQDPDDGPGASAGGSSSRPRASSPRSCSCSRRSVLCSGWRRSCGSCYLLYTTVEEPDQAGLPRRLREHDGRQGDPSRRLTARPNPVTAPEAAGSEDRRPSHSLGTF